ncbi:hypothetical protein CAPTEDRAFT_191540 [Capitella teleta]|uniref:Uncharacterized protein n=1 Tax=Capitella teleta TaxID=283909 RepID=R7U1W6_CAPTE|nr:hypothetical protein CAPTEDRAFT_191540 [Capitella teleta]|eukprot:ELU00219.1 hypothetical protein CAPTEDRAFT_191540 [Capitella teleta]
MSESWSVVDRNPTLGRKCAENNKYRMRRSCELRDALGLRKRCMRGTYSANSKTTINLHNRLSAFEKVTIPFMQDYARIDGAYKSSSTGWGSGKIPSKGLPRLHEGPNNLLLRTADSCILWLRMLDDNSTISVLHDPLLAFVAANKGSATSAHIIRTVTLSRFTPDQVLVAKNLLWDVDIAARLLGENPKRVTNQARTASEAHLSHVLEALRKFDDADQLPRIAVYASDFHLVPRIRAGDIDVVSLAERLQDIESSLQDLQSIRDRVSIASPASSRLPTTPLQSTSAALVPVEPSLLPQPTALISESAPYTSSQIKLRQRSRSEPGNGNGNGSPGRRYRVALCVANKT